jgi:UPF0755 protein
MNKKLKITAAALLGSLMLFASGYYYVFAQSNLPSNEVDCACQVKQPISSEDVWQVCNTAIKNRTTWKIAAKLKRLNMIKPGLYRFKNGMSNNAIVREFRSGGLATVMLRIDDVTSLEELSAKLGQSLLHDSAHFMSCFSNDSLLSSFDSNASQAASLIRPNTYEFYWHMDGASFLKKMKDEYYKLWNVSRLNASKELGLSQHEVITLASIVKAETSNLGEAPLIAGLYLNRLRIGMPLQSDPTALFGRRKSAGRVYLSDIQSDTPYNTYKFRGLPPGPINFPENTYIDAVLKAEQHSYLYMCAEPGATGKHRFSLSLAEHERNRAAYIQWLNNQQER